MTTDNNPINWNVIISRYQKVQDAVKTKVMSIMSGNMSQLDPVAFLKAQFYMSQMTQCGESMSNLISTFNTMINFAVRNQKSQ
jgi:hypothetical protein